MREVLNLLLFDGLDGTIALAAEHVDELTRFDGDDDIPSFFDQVGLPSPPCRSELVATVRESGCLVKFRVPPPTALIDVPLADLHPVPRLIRPLLTVSGLSALLLLHGTLVPVFDPTVVARTNEGSSE